MRVDPRKCSLAAGAAPIGCDWCGKSILGLPKPFDGSPRRWCQPLCAKKWFQNHHWNVAKAAVKERDGYACVRCGRHSDLEVNHIRPLSSSALGRKLGYKPSCLHHLVNLETLCRRHHLEATAQQRADGLIGKRNRNR